MVARVAVREVGLASDASGDARALSLRRGETSGRLHARRRGRSGGATADAEPRTPKVARSTKPLTSLYLDYLSTLYYWLLVHARRCQCSLPHAPPVGHLHVGRVRRRVTQPRKQRS